MKFKVSYIKRKNSNFNKFIFRTLSLSLFFSNLPVLSNATNVSNEIPDRYEVLEGEYITINDSEENIIKDIEIFGNTIQDENNLEDIQSVGDLYIDKDANPILDKDGREQYRLNIVSTGKNLFNGLWESGEISPDGTLDFNSNEIRSNFIKVESNNQYICSNDGIKRATHYTFYDKDKNFISATDRYNPSEKLITPDKCMYIRLSGGIELREKFQIEEGYQITQYKPYQENKISILSPTPLEKVGDVTDKIICKNGVWGG